MFLYLTTYTMTEKETKDCPYCWEEILATAKKCKHCWEFLDWTQKKQDGQFAWNINYKSWMKIKCPSCWYEWKAKKIINGSSVVEFLLLLLWIFPWIIYAIWRRFSTGKAKCPKCWNTLLTIKTMK